MYNVDQQKAIDLAGATEGYSEIVSFLTASGPHSIFPRTAGLSRSIQGALHNGYVHNGDTLWSRGIFQEFDIY